MNGKAEVQILNDHWQNSSQLHSAYYMEERKVMETKGSNTTGEKKKWRKLSEMLPLQVKLIT